MYVLLRAEVDNTETDIKVLNMTFKMIHSFILSVKSTYN